MSNDFYLRWRTERLRETLRSAGVTFTGAETATQLEALVTGAGISLAAQPPLVLKSAIGASSDPTSPAGAAGNINSSTTTGLVMADPRLSFPNLRVGQQVRLNASVTLGIASGGGTGVLIRAAQLVQSVDAGSTWTKLGRLMRAKGDATSVPEMNVGLVHSFTVATAGSYVFGIQIGNTDNVASIVAVSQTRCFEGQVS